MQAPATWQEDGMDDRRRYERVRLPDSAETYVVGIDGKRIGMVRVLGAGGLLVETERRFPEFTPHRLTLIDEGAGVNRKLTVVARHTSPEGTGFEFLAPDISVAVEIGIIIGRYLHAAPSARVALPAEN
jgi:hypothetical protein